MFYFTTIFVCFISNACGQQIVNCYFDHSCSEYNKAKNESGCYVKLLYTRQDAGGKYFNNKSRNTLPCLHLQKRNLQINLLYQALINAIYHLNRLT